jgi:hypothetical protein
MRNLLVVAFALARGQRETFAFDLLLLAEGIFLFGGDATTEDVICNGKMHVLRLRRLIMQTCSC